MDLKNAWCSLRRTMVASEAWTLEPEECVCGGMQYRHTVRNGYKGRKG